MNEEEQRIAIAEACGWKFKINDSNYIGELMCKMDELSCWLMPALSFIPNYLNDLNAMHDAEKTLKYEYDRIRYINTLQMVIALGKDERSVSTFQTISATAKQRAEAFLKTLKLWEHTK
jgi:hypothetical protein